MKPRPQDLQMAALRQMEPRLAVHRIEIKAPCQKIQFTFECRAEERVFSERKNFHRATPSFRTCEERN